MKKRNRDGYKKAQEERAARLAKAKAEGELMRARAADPILREELASTPKERASRLAQNRAPMTKKTRKRMKRLGALKTKRNKEKTTKLIAEGCVASRSALIVCGSTAHLNKEVKNIHDTADKLRKMGREVEVDHIIPIKHDLVCGLNVPANLQILSKEDNRAKSNKFRPYSLKNGIKTYI